MKNDFIGPVFDLVAFAWLGFILGFLVSRIEDKWHW